MRQEGVLGNMVHFLGTKYLKHEPEFILYLNHTICKTSDPFKSFGLH